MPAIAAPVSAWVATSLGSMGVAAATATTVGAIAGNVAIGVVAGAAIGAATSVITGGDILDGALRGAAIGGVTMGVVSGISVAASGVASVANTANAAIGAETAAQGGLFASMPTAGSTGVMMSGTAEAAIGTLGQTTAQTAVQTAQPSLWSSILGSSAEGMTGTKVMLAGAVQGAAEALLAPEPETTEERISAIQRLNKSGDLLSQNVQVTIPEHWSRYNRLSDSSLAEQRSHQSLVTNKQQQQLAKQTGLLIPTGGNNASTNTARTAKTA